MALQKTYQYKIFTSAGLYIGLLDPKKITNDFEYNQTLKSAGTQIEIYYAQNEPDSKIVNDNLIQVIEFSQYYPNGLTVFLGYISKYKVNFGGDNNIVLTCISNGQDLSQYIIEVGDSTFLSQLTDNNTLYQVGSQDAMSQTWRAIEQTFTVGSNISVGSVDIMINTQEAASMFVFIRQMSGGSPNIPGDGIVVSATVNMPSGLSRSIQHIVFNSPATLSTGNTYYIGVEWNGGGVSTCQIIGTTGNPYANGSVYQQDFTGGTSWQGSVIVTNNDLYFNIYQHGGSTTATYTSRDTSFMLTDLMNSYNQRGGLMQIPGNPLTPLEQITFNDNNIPGAFWACAYAQPFTPGVGQTINIVQLFLGSSSGSESVTLSLCKGDPSLDTVNVIGGTESYTFGGSNVRLATSNSRTISSTISGIVGFSFSTPQVLTGGTQYYILLEFGQTGFGNLLFKGGSTGETSPSPFGTLYYGLCTINNVSTGMATHSGNPNMWIALSYVNPVPTVLDAGYLPTGTVTSYTFKFQTMLTAVGVIDSLSPFDWYWYGDPGTNNLIWQETSATPDLMIIKGRHINQIEVEATREGIVNVVYFTGGDDGTGTSHNVFVKRTSAIGSNRVGLATLSDNRVSGTGGNTVGAQIASSYLNQQANETYITTVTIMDNVADTNLYKLGKLIGFSGFGDFIDSLTMQVVGLTKRPDSVTLNLGTLAIRPTQAVAQIEAGLNSVETLANPATPS